MRNSTYIAIISLSVAFSITLILRYNLNKTEERILPPPNGMEYIHMGFNETISDILWLNYIQNLWNCHKEGRCHKNWGYRVLDEATVLTPRFKSLYTHGATGLSVLLDDDYGAKIIYDRGLLEYPKDWVLNYRAGYHYLIELNEDERAASLFDAAGDYGAPIWTKSLAAKLYERSGNLEVSEFVLQSMIASSPDNAWTDSLKKRLTELRQKKLSEKK